MPHLLDRLSRRAQIRVVFAGTAVLNAVVSLVLWSDLSIGSIVAGSIGCGLGVAWVYAWRRPR